MKRIFATLARRLEADPVVALVTVVKARGSTPREAGARMMVTADGSIAGTVGGGRLELEAIEGAREAIAAGTAHFELRAFALGPGLGQCCGGHVTLAIETFTQAMRTDLLALAEAEVEGGLRTLAAIEGSKPLARQRLDRRAFGPATAWIDKDGRLCETFAPQDRPVLIFGAGHVGRSLVLALAPLPFAVRWIDERAEMFPAAVPANIECVVDPDPARIARAARPGSFILIMTHDHGMDLDILHAALETEDLGYVGLIGSATKRARFESRLTALGMDSQKSSEFRCPIGLAGIRSKEPALIAASVAAELLVEDERLGIAGQTPVRRPVGVFG